MTRYLHTLFDPGHRWKTISFFVLGVLLIVAAQLVGIADNAPGLVLLYAGIIFLFLTFIHHWRKPSSYGIMAGICAAVIAVTVIVVHIYAASACRPGEVAAPSKADGIMEAIVMTITLFLCAPGILIGLAGLIF